MKTIINNSIDSLIFHTASKSFLRKIFLGIIITLFSTANYAQDLNFEWAKSMGSQIYEIFEPFPYYGDVGYSITTDAMGNVYTTGNYSGLVDFDPNNGTFNLDPFGYDDDFIQKLDENGNLIWAKTVGGSFSYGNPWGWSITHGLPDISRSITIDASGNVYITGGFSSSGDFDPGPGTYDLISGSNSDIYILKLDENGDFIWARSLMGTEIEISPYEFYYITNYASSISIDASENVYVTGVFVDTVDFDPSPDTFNLVSNGIEDIFILKLDHNGDFIWAKSMGSIDHDAGASITTNATGDVYVTGVFSSTADFDPGDQTFNLASNGEKDIFILKLTSSGELVYAKSMGSIYDDAGSSIIAEASGDVYINGSFSDMVNFNPGSASYNLISNGEQDAFIMKLDDLGNFIWATSIGGNSQDNSTAVSTDALGNVYTTGFYNNTVDFDPGPGNLSLTSNGMSDIFIQKLDPTGNFILAKSIGGADLDIGNSITTNAAGNIYATGYFNDTVDFDPGNEVFNLNGHASRDIFVLKLSQPLVDVYENALSKIVSFFPNPSQGQITLDLGDLSDVSISVYSLSGSLVFHQENIEDPLYHFELNAEAGIYILEVSSQQESQRFKLVKQ